MQEKNLIGFLCILAIVCGRIESREVKSKASNIEDTYGALVDEDQDKDVQNDDNYYDGDDEDVDNPPEKNEVATKIPQVLTKPADYYADIGNTVVLPCQFSSPDGVLVWSHGNTILFQAGVMLRSDLHNFHLLPNNSLQVQVRADEDLGDYTCSMLVASDIKPSVTHKIQRLNPVTIEGMLTIPNNKSVWNVGEDLTIKCQAKGYPEPKISWHKDGERLSVEGKTLRIEDLHFKDGGIYRCLADNNVGKPAHSHIEIFVNHKPIVSVEKYIVNSDKEQDAELKCTVKAYPAPVVLWQKNGQNVVEHRPKITLSRHDNNVINILTIKDLEEGDFGTYTCVAQNGLGKVQKNINLVKTPAIRGFQKPDKANKDVVLTWKVESKSPISRHELQYRKKGESEWQNINPEVTNSEDDIYTIKYTLSGLGAGTYEARARSQNTHGWSDYSDIMPFEGVLAKHGAHHNKHHGKKTHKENDAKEKHSDTEPGQHQEPESTKESSLGASQVGGTSTVTSSTVLLSIPLLLMFIIRQ